MRNDDLTTIKEEIKAALCDGDKPEDLLCYYQERREGYTQDEEIVKCLFDELPDREYDSGYGGNEGPRVICFSLNYVYVCGTYDGSEWVQAVPRNPELVDHIPLIGGG